MPITLLDGLLLVIMFISAVLAMIRGFVREVLSIVSWVAAAAAAFLLYERVLPYTKQYINHDLVAMGVSAAAVFLVTLLVVSYITMRISDFVLDSRIGALDRTLGFVFGAVRGLLLVVVAMMFFNWFVQPEQQPNWVKTAKSRPILLSIGERLVAVLPEDPEKAILDKIRQNNQAGGGATPTDEPAYSDSERQGLEQLTTDSN
ncbi:MULTISPECIES: CvpA family protein [Stappiaceae]|mgnify:CR=1 FL=1|jgi:membrane protein required for colicin V production|uniref:Pur regulon 18 kDa protein n=2 Tax=Roseibium TaxID=150830 RepID=A0A0M6XXM5_9HYPH|nr:MULTISPECIES: CvpA family protein [Stappiaceae]MCR9282474.1 CvpA family protein [Paracoccaceae bacterium]MEC9401858.1 CvpA family protein [Pseudomonadota bacterium]AMN53885.1 colicin V synthesis protein [Labrenzia sp. CP4]AQQ02292.1 colicin V synthesis protein [Roseibium aggregatum]ERP85690.1 colicin V synthesis protein [Labrenzia sp. C1B10]